VIKPVIILKSPIIFYAVLCMQVAMFFPEAVQAENSGNYVSFALAGGGGISPDAELKSNPPVGEANFDPGYSIKVSLGLTLAEKFQLEAEYLHTSNRIESLTGSPPVTSLVNSDRTTDSMMLNAIYRMETPPLGDENWVRRGFFLYFGGGAGIAWQDYSLETVAGGSDSSLAWQVMVGFEKMNPSRYMFASMPSPFLQYRFLHIAEGNFGSFEADASLHLIEFGFRFYGGIGG